jgi:hypothetical protein
MVHNGARRHLQENEFHDRARLRPTGQHRESMNVSKREKSSGLPSYLVDAVSTFHTNNSFLIHCSDRLRL